MREWLKLPVPPSANNLFKNVPGQGRKPTKAYTKWQSDCRYYVKMREPDEKGMIYRVQIVANIDRKRDIDNIIKPTLDLLKKLGHIYDDRYVDSVHIDRGRWLGIGQPMDKSFMKVLVQKRIGGGGCETAGA